MKGSDYGPERRVAIIGAGSIGVGWAVAFARAGWTVSIQDTDPNRLRAAPFEIDARMRQLVDFGLAAPSGQRTISEADLETAVDGAAHVQECAPENLDLKRLLLARLNAVVAPHVAIASSSSMLTPSKIASGLAGNRRILVAHPGNPPYLLRVVELVPGPFTDASFTERTTHILESIGMVVVRLRKEIEGFVFNRLQGALLREAYRLVDEDVVGVDELDMLVREGLGRRWSIVGPFETVDLNTRGGIEEHARRMGASYLRMGQERGERSTWTDTLVQKVTKERRRLLPLERWAQRVEWRDRMLMTVERALRGGGTADKVGDDDKANQ